MKPKQSTKWLENIEEHKFENNKSCRDLVSYILRGIQNSLSGKSPKRVLIIVFHPWN